MTKNQLFYGDNLEILRNDIASESMDLIYLDPHLIPKPPTIFFSVPQAAKILKPR